MNAVQSIAIKRVPSRSHAVERCGMAWQPTSLPAVRFTATFLAHAMARAQYNPTIGSVWSPPAQPVIRTSRLIKGYCGRGVAVCELVYIGNAATAVSLDQTRCSN